MDWEVGEKVILSRSWGHSSIMEVERLTARYVILKNYSKAKFRKDSGKMAGGDTWNTESISKATPETINKIKKGQFIRGIKTLADGLRNDLSDEVISLEEAVSLYEQLKKIAERGKP
ncbi:MAG: hypothetical protein ACM3UK_00070 [Actinomycetes bacterium]